MRRNRRRSLQPCSRAGQRVRSATRHSVGQHVRHPAGRETSSGSGSARTAPGSQTPCQPCRDSSPPAGLPGVAGCPAGSASGVPRGGGSGLEEAAELAVLLTEVVGKGHACLGLQLAGAGRWTIESEVAGTSNDRARHRCPDGPPPRHRPNQRRLREVRAPDPAGSPSAAGPERPGQRPRPEDLWNRARPQDPEPTGADGITEQVN